MARTRDSRTSQCFFSSSSRTESFGHFRSHLNKQEPPPPSRSSLVLLCLFFTRHGRPYSCTALWATLWFLCSMSLRNTTTRRREKASALSNAPLMSFNCWRESREREEDFWKRKKTFGVIDSLSVGDLSNNIPTASPLISNRSLPLFVLAGGQEVVEDEGVKWKVRVAN